jgi:two-component system, sensor histidine kinase PdtaS
VEIALNPIETDDGTMVLSAIVDISHRKREEERIQAALKEKDILLGEIHHRVNNNLQIVYSLLHLQSARISDRAALDLLCDSQNRVRSMALIHQTHYGSKDFAKVDFGLFIETLLPALIGSYAIDSERIQVHVDVEPVRLPIDAAVPCGLVLNELITNALKHAFQDRDHGEIRIALIREPGNEALLTVSDNGIGLPDHIDTARADTLGLQLVGLLADQIDGAISIHRAAPTSFALRFPI